MKKTRQKSNDFKNIAEEITPKDDAFHGSKKVVAAEWWYFDAVFSNNYSVHIGFRTFSKKKLGMIMPFLEIYKDGKLEFEGKKRFRFKNFKTSRNFPYVKIFNSFSLEFDIERHEENGEWIYRVMMKMGENAVDLTFRGITEGWKIETDRESWTVGLPKANVSGEIQLNGKKIKVNGIGYHDHNWNFSFRTAVTYAKAWYWGKIRSKNFNIVWANIMKKDDTWDLIAVVNKDDGGFYNIKPEKVFFKPDKYVKSRGKKIPYEFLLKFDDVVDKTPIDVEIKMHVKDFHYGKVLTRPYWRYHVNSKGYIMTGGKKEKLDNMEIIEFISFK